ncbi:caspase-like [Anopheles nili]|uniref:caspase-like n=1 Tax=Anopheles nili TaxID=185578 RepID=UPI00237A8FC1|nr:caspase-like [Anopheles nili]
MENEKPTRPQSDVPDVVDSNPINLEYDTKHAKRGIAVIFNQVNFKNLEKRNGSDKDCDSIHKTLIHLGFDVRVHKDSKQSEIKNELTTIANEDHSNNDCFMLVIMTHGEENTLHASDKIFEQNLLWENFIGANCPTLIGKPKLFFIQACRGRSFDGGV